MNHIVRGREAKLMKSVEIGGGGIGQAFLRRQVISVNFEVLLRAMKPGLRTFGPKPDWLPFGVP